MAVADQPNAADLQQKYRQFLDLLPLTISLAGLPTSEGRLYNEEIARQTARRMEYTPAIEG